MLKCDADSSNWLVRLPVMHSMTYGELDCFICKRLALNLVNSIDAQLPESDCSWRNILFHDRGGESRGGEVGDESRGQAARLNVACPHKIPAWKVRNNRADMGKAS